MFAEIVDMKVDTIIIHVTVTSGRLLSTEYIYFHEMCNNLFPEGSVWERVLTLLHCHT